MLVAVLGWCLLAVTGRDHRARSPAMSAAQAAVLVGFVKLCHGNKQGEIGDRTRARSPKAIAQHTAKNCETSNCRKIDDKNPNNSANTDIYAYSETTIDGSTMDVYCRLWNDKKLNLCVLSYLRRC